MRLHLCLITLGLALIDCCGARAVTVTIENPGNLPVSQEQVSALYTIVCQEVAKGLHIHDFREIETPLTLILGEEPERYTSDNVTGKAAIYLKEWDESRFAISAAMILYHQRLSSSRQFRVVIIKTLGRFRTMRPITLSEVKTGR